MPRLDLRVQVGVRSSHHMGAWTWFGPGRGMQAMADRGVHQLVVCRVKIHLIGAPPEAVVGVELRPALVGLSTQREIVRRATGLPKDAQGFGAPLPPFTNHGGSESRILGVEVVVAQIMRQVFGLVGVSQPIVRRSSQGLIHSVLQCWGQPGNLRITKG